MPTLPLDLERLIFETAALQDTDHDSRVRLILVAKRVYEWIRPILYRVAIAKVDQGQFTRNWRGAQIADVAPFVRHLLVSSGPHTELLSSFHNVENLALWIGPCFSKDLKKTNDLPLRMLSISLMRISLDEAVDYCPAFRNITHLELTVMEGSDCKVLVEFPKLTHLSFDTQAVRVGDEVISDMLEHCPSLQALVYQVDHECTISSDDLRFLVFQDHMYLEDYITEWERSANGGIGLWELADLIIEARKYKLLKDNTFTFSRRTWMGSLNDDGLQWYNDMMYK